MKRHILAIFCMLFTGYMLMAQIPVSNVVFENNLTSSGTTYTKSNKTYRFGSQSGGERNHQTVTGFILPGQSFFYNSFINGEIRVRRVNNSTTTGKKTLVWMESLENSNTYRIFPAYKDDMEQVLNGRIINQGTDNFFGNQGDGGGNNNNVERMDWIVQSGIKVSQVNQAGFVVFDRGADNQHDPFCIAAVLSIDNQGNPTQYGNVVRVSTQDFGNMPSSSVSYSILQKEETDDQLFRSSTGSQNRGGVFIPLQNLGVATNQIVYGYSLFASDLPSNATPLNLLDYTNSTYFPTTTSSTTGEGGIDLIAITGLFNSGTVFVTLPLQLQQWNAERVGEKVSLTWRLADTSNCAKVIVEKSSNGSQWMKAAELDGSQTKWLDATVNDAQYYRLQLVSLNGSVHYSDLKKVGARHITENISSLRANVNNGQVQLWFQAVKESETTVRLISMNGSVVWQQKVVIQKGINHLSFPGITHQGAAIIELQTGNESVKQKIGQ